MPLSPTIKTWQPVFHYSNPLSGVAKTDYDAIFIAAKNQLKASNTPCTVAGSSNGTTAALDGVDRIVTTANIVNANPGSAHSWIVLNLVGMGSAQVLFEYANVNALQLGITFSANGLFTGGSTTASPTATDGQVLHSVGSLWCGSTTGTGGQFRVHVIRTLDGANTRAFFCINSVVAAFWSFETVYAGPAIGVWPTPYACAAVGIGAGISDNTLLNIGGWVGINARFKSWCPVGGGQLMDLDTTLETARGGWVGNRYSSPEELSGEYPLNAVGLWHDTIVGARGTKGIVPDMYFTATGPVMGDTYPASGSKLWQQMGQMIIPDDGSTWLIS